MDLTYTDPRSAENLLQSNLLVKHYAGSHAYGTSLPTSDVDFRGIFCADPVNLLTPFFPIRETIDTNEEDTKFYELSHFMKLCLDCNPNIVETLWVDHEDITYGTTGYQHLRQYRSKLLSSKVAFTFSGYALAQLKRIKGHHKWINNPQPKQPPKPKDFLSVVQYFGGDKNLKPDLNVYRNGYQLVPYGNNIYGAYYSMEHRRGEKTYQLWNDQGGLNDQFDGNREQLGNPMVIVKWNRDEYKLAKEKHEQYWTWKNNRNKVRGELEEKYHYDTKHASHLVRLLRMGVEILRDENVIVKRPDAEELLGIRNGDWTYEEIVKYAESMDKEVREVWYKKTNLPKKPDIKFAAKLLMETQEIVWRSNEYSRKD